MAITHAIVKVTQGCNIACKYCYVDHYGFGSKKLILMDIDVLESLFSRISEYVQSQELSRFTFYWHGGEPLLQPPSFYESVREFQQKYLPRTKVTHLLQTNGVRLTRHYARLLKDLGIVTSISLDGPPEVNDALRVDHAGHPTSAKVIKGIEALRSEGHPLQILCVLGPAAMRRGAEIYRYFRSMDTVWMDFLLPHASLQHTTIDLARMPSQREFAQFFIDVYDEWMDEANSEICVRRLRDYTQLLLGAAPDTCIFSDDCSYIITVLPDGSIYPCDDLLSTFPEALGTLQTHRLETIKVHPTLCKVCKNSTLMFAKECLECDYFDVCRSGCTNFRSDKNKSFANKYFYCEMSTLVIDHIRSDLLRRLSESGIRPLPSS